MKATVEAAPTVVSKAGTHAEVPESETTLTGTVRLSIDPGQITAAVNQSIELSLTCDSETRAKLVVPISWRVSPRIEVVPDRLFLGAEPAGSVVTRRVLVRANEGGFSGDLVVEKPVGEVLKDVKQAGQDESHRFVDVTVRFPEAEGA